MYKLTKIVIESLQIYYLLLFVCAQVMFIFMSPIKAITPVTQFKQARASFNEFVKLILSTESDLYMYNKIIGILLIFNKSFTMLFSGKL